MAGTQRSARAFDPRLMRLAATERPTLTGSVALGLGVAAARIATGVALAVAIGRVFDGAPMTDVVPPLVLAVALVGFRAVCTAVQEGIMAGASVRITADLRRRLVDRILRLGPAWVTGERSGELEAVLVDGVERLDVYFRLFLSKVIVAGISAVAIVVVIWIVDPVVGALVALFAAALVAIPPIEYRALETHMRFWSESYRPLAAEFVDGLQGMATLKMFGAARRRGEDLFRRAHDVRDSAIGLTKVSAVFWGIMAFVAGAGVAVALAAGAFRLADGAITPAQLMLILLLAGECFLPAREINEAMHTAVWGMSKCERAFAVLETEPAVGPPRDREPHEPAGAGIVVEDVTFRYRPGDAPALQDVSFSVGAGETVAIVGPSGAGKTTLASLLLRFADPEAGHDPGRRRRSARGGPTRAPAHDRARSAGHLPVPRDGRREPPADPAGCHRRRPGRRARIGGRLGVRRDAARRGGHRGRGARVPPVGRRAAADRDRACPVEGRADPDPG